LKLSVQDKIDALRELTRGADDVYAVYGLTNRVGEGRWRPCYSSLEDHVLRLHLSGHLEIGSYPLLPGKWPDVYWVLADFDGKRPGTDWKRDVQNAVEVLMDHEGLPCFVNLSRSGKGAHIRLLFKEPVPAYLARRFMDAWLEEAGVLINEEDWGAVPPSFDRLIPPQDTLSGGVNDDGYRLPGNLAGSPLHAGHARHNGGSLPLSTKEAARGNFEPDGKHWEHVMTALERRAWGRAELLAAIADCPGSVSTEPPTHSGTFRALPILRGDDAELQYVQTFCRFMQEMHQPHAQSYALWVALATQLHRFGEAGRNAFHEISAMDPRYDAEDVEKKWVQTERLHPVRCETLVKMGYRCPHLDDERCNGSPAPTYFIKYQFVEIL
jgi:hypothetical protein